MGTISHSLVQRVHHKFSTHEPLSNFQTYVHPKGDGALHSQDDANDEHIRPGIELAVTVQPLAKPSIASFPGDASAVQEQYPQWASDSYRDSHQVSQCGDWRHH